MKIYFAHPMSTYGTSTEKKAIAKIKKHFGELAEVLNPSDEQFVAAIKVIYPHTGMCVFDLIAAKADIVVAMPYADGRHGAGVFSEITAAHRAGKKIFEISDAFIIEELNYFECEALSVSETRHRIRQAQK